MKKDVGVLELSGNIKQDLWEFKIGVRQPIFYKKTNKYIGGIDLGLYLYGQNIKEEDKKPENAIIVVEAGIAGLFAVQEDKRFDEETENSLVRIQIPALLFPYLRGAITSLLANAGFGSVVLPLINIHELAKESLKDVNIKVID
ncbi:MAG: protein-export chaperone SecB [bacterium]